MERRGIARFVPLMGLLFLVLAVVSFALSGDGPDADESTQKHVEFWSDEEGKQIASALIACYAALVFVWFASRVRQLIARTEPQGGALASLSFAGTVIFATGLLVNNAIQFAAAESAGDASPQVTETLSVLYGDFFFPMAVGMSLFLIASGAAAVRYGAFNRFLGWAAIVIGVLAITPAGFIGSMIWTGIAGIVLFLGQDRADSGGAAAVGPEAPVA